MEEILIPEKIKLEKEDGNLGIFVIEPCYPGYGHTLGNALRRVLLSSLPGAAVGGVKIKGVNHEFSSIPHVKEDVVEIILNLKQLRLKIHSHEPNVRLKLVSKGKKEITANDIEKNSEVEIINPDLLIATALDKKAEVEMEIVVEKGRGYVPVEQKESKNLDIGLILTDSIFSSVVKVSYDVENMRVGQRTDFDLLRLVIETDGTISPREALTKAAEILVEHFEFITGAKKASKEKVKEKIEDKKENTAGGVNDRLVQELKLSTRTANALDKAKVRKVGDLVSRSEEDLLSLEGFGETALKEVKKSLKKLGVTLKEIIEEKK